MVDFLLINLNFFYLMEKKKENEKKEINYNNGIYCIESVKILLQIEMYSKFVCYIKWTIDRL